MATMKKPARKMRARDRWIILFVALMGLSIAGVQLYFHAMVERWGVVIP